MSKKINKFHIRFKAIYQVTINFSVFIFSCALLVAVTRLLAEELKTFPTIIILGYIIGGLSLCLYTLTKNWSLLK